MTSARYNRHQMLTDEEARRIRSYRTLQAENASCIKPPIQKQTMGPRASRSV